MTSKRQFADKMLEELLIHHNTCDNFPDCDICMFYEYVRLETDVTWEQQYLWFKKLTEKKE